MPEKEYTPSPWEHPEKYKEFREEHPRKRERSLSEYLIMKLSAAGFAIEEVDDKSMRIWVRGGDPNTYYVIRQTDDTYKIVESAGAFNTAKNRKVLSSNLAQWISWYKSGVRL